MSPSWSAVPCQRRVHPDHSGLRSRMRRHRNTAATGQPHRTRVSGTSAARPAGASLPLDRASSRNRPVMRFWLIWPLKTGSSAISGRDRLHRSIRLSDFLLRRSGAAHRSGGSYRRGGVRSKAISRCRNAARRRCWSVWPTRYKLCLATRWKPSGMGYLSPITTNLSAEGRERNRPCRGGAAQHQLILCGPQSVSAFR